MNLKKHVRQILAEARAEADRLGVSIRVEQRGKHAQILLSRNGVTRKTPIPSSPSSRDDAIRAKRGDVRRILREFSREEAL